MAAWGSSLTVPHEAQETSSFWSSFFFSSFLSSSPPYHFPLRGSSPGQQHPLNSWTPATSHTQECWSLEASTHYLKLCTYPVNGIQDNPIHPPNKSDIWLLMSHVWCVSASLRLGAESPRVCSVQGAEFPTHWKCPQMWNFHLGCEILLICAWE